MTQCAEHVAYQLPNEFTRVGYLMTAIECSDPKLQAAMANIDGDSGPGGKRSDFEAAAAYLLPKDPVASRQPANLVLASGRARFVHATKTRLQAL